MTTLTLTEFLLARIAEDEAAASWTVNELTEHSIGPGVALMPAEQLPRGTWGRMRVMAECEAKRRIVELHPVYRGPRLLQVHSTRTHDYACELCHATSSIDDESVIEALGPCDTIMALASVYADHPDYREEWRP